MFDFEDAQPVTRPFSGGKQAEPNPFTDIIAAIALKVNQDTGKPVAKSFVITHDDEESVIKDRRKVTRQTSQAGRNNDPQVTVRISFTDENDIIKSGPNQGNVRTYRTRVTFWTVKPYQSKTRKDENNAPDNDTPENNTPENNTPEDDVQE